MRNGIVKFEVNFQELILDDESKNVKSDCGTLRPVRSAICLTACIRSSL